MKKMPVIFISVYMALFLCASIFMLVSSKAGNEFAGIFAVIVTLPWSLAVLPIGLISPGLMDKHSDLIGQIVILAGGVINLCIIYWIFHVINRGKVKKQSNEINS
jgi:hypothetical protein